MTLPVLLQVLGIFVLAGGLWMLTPWLGVAVLGALIVLLGVSLEIGMRNKDGSSRPDEP